ncbi:MAG: SDR family oxidoreductase [Eubacterium sp.]|nr:SDR family oxidoreductase [Eubacterium sp.]
MDLKLNDKLILVTGSTAGMGKALAKILLQEGAKVIINARTEASVDKIWDELCEYGAPEKAIGDLATAEGAQAVINAVDAIGELDVLVNNAGIYNAIPFEEMTDEDWQYMFNVNLMSVVRLSRYYLPRMIRRNSGKILNFSSEVAYKPLPTFLHYCASKAAILNLS